jgi:hypothetical protein
MGEAEPQSEPHEPSIKPPVSGDEEPSAATPGTGSPLSDRVESELYAGNRVLSLLFNTQGRVWKYIVRAGLISLVPSLLVSFVVASVGLGNEENLPQFAEEVGAGALFVSLVIVTPAVETLLLGLGLWLLSFATRRPLRQALGSCVLWGVLHSLLAPAWGLVVAWPFFVFSCAYLAWRRRSWWHAAGVACGIHMFQNLLPGILVAVT